MFSLFSDLGYGAQAIMIPWDRAFMYPRLYFMTIVRDEYESCIAYTELSRIVH